MTGVRSGWLAGAAMVVGAGIALAVSGAGGGAPAIPSRVVVDRVAVTAPAGGGQPSQRPSHSPTTTPSAAPTTVATPSTEVVAPSRPVVTEGPDDHGGRAGGDR